VERYLIKLGIRTAVWLFMLLLTISVIRATTVIVSMRKIAAGHTTNVRLARRWAAHHPVLWRGLERMITDTQRNEFVGYHASERVILAAPDFIVNFFLKNTSVLWLNSLVAAGEQRKHIAETAPPPPAQPPKTTAAAAPRRPAPPPPQAQAAQQPASPPAQAGTPPSEPPPTVTPPPQEPASPPVDQSIKWAAITTHSAPIFTREGQRSNNVDAGSIMEITGERRTQDGVIFAGNVHSPQGRFRNVFVREQDLQIYMGKTLQETTREERELASEKARIMGDIAVRRQDIENAQAQRNPHQGPYRDLLRKYQGFRQEAEKLQSVYDNSSGEKRISAGNRLREINQEIAIMMPQIRQLRDQRDAWNQANPASPVQDPERDPRIMEMRQRLSELD
jgi:hypothetical protein